MTHPLTAKTVYVEGDDDVRILKAWFPSIPSFTKAGGKDEVAKRTQSDTACHGLKDRDFATDTEVAASRAPDSRLALLRRYCIENYLLEPDIIASAMSAMPALKPALATWEDHAFVRRQLIQWGTELALYAAANSIIAEWKLIVETDFRRYFSSLPPLPRDQVVQELQRRLASLSRPEDVEDALNTQYSQIQQDIAAWEGLHRWISGKVLLEDCLYPRVFESTGLSQARLRDALIEAGKGHVPAELQELAARWSLPF